MVFSLSDSADKMSVPNMGHFTAFLQCVFQVPLSIGISMQESHQELKEEPGILEDHFSCHSSADHHLQGKLLVKMLDDKHKKHYIHTMTICEDNAFLFLPTFFLKPNLIAC